MAKVELFLGNQNINLNGSVGKNGANLKNDVMVVQAMLKFALEGRSGFRNLRFPFPTGLINDETIELIKEYQRFERKTGVRLSVDGRIDPAKGVKAFGRKGFWTILALNTLVMERWLLNGGRHNNPIEALCRQFPQLFSAIVNVPSGTLNLPIESSIKRVGSLNLSLE